MSGPRSLRQALAFNFSSHLVNFRRLPFLPALAFALACSAGSAVAADPRPPATATNRLATPILQELRAFRELGSVLYVAAHPDDENTQLITYLARGRGYRTGYLSLTRGDGGQNESGPEFGEKLGLARTWELLAARQLDGGHQFFTRALDFGYSKDVNETLRIWDRQQVLADVVRVIRQFRPDVVITRFSPTPSSTHGHHTASSVLALEAFKLAGDPTAFPEQLAPSSGLTPWQPKRILHNNTPYNSQLNANSPLYAKALKLEVAGTDPGSGEAFGAIANRSRAMHITQGFGSLATAQVRSSRLETFELLAGDRAATDLLDGVDVSWSRYPGGAVVGTLIDTTIADFNPADPTASVAALLTLRERLAAWPADPVLTAKRTQLDHLLQACLGLVIETISPQAEVTPGEILALAHRATLRSGGATVRWVSIRYPSLNTELAVGTTLAVGATLTREAQPTLPKSTPPSQPYWLRAEGTAGMSVVADAELIGRPVNPPAFPVEFVFEIAGQTLSVSDEPIQIVAPASAAQARRPLAVVAPVALAFADEVALLAPNSHQPTVIEVTAARANAAGTLRLELPAGWLAAPATHPFHLKNAGDKIQLTFTLTAPAHPATASIRAVADLDGLTYDQQRIAIRYPHLPVLLLQPTARLQVVALDLAIRGRKVGYLPGAGDNTSAALQQMGYAVTLLTGADLTPEKLHDLDAVVIGVRAFNERTDLAAHLSGLFAYSKAGGTVIAQYNRPNGLKTPTLAPYALSIMGDAPSFRVTDENAVVTFLAPNHPALTTPNRLGPADFTGWVQERGAYFPSTWDETKFTALLAMHDPGAAPLTSSILVAPYGQGYFVYTSLAFFRQLPAGVPGAYRLFANLVSLKQ
jgi:LmbE family N-acetylglucosaminyl deacetylase